MNIPNGKKLIAPSASCFQYMGRIDDRDIDAPMLVWAGSRVSLKFKGTEISAALRNIKFQDETHFGVVVDGFFKKIFFKDSAEDELYELASGLEDGWHTVDIVKTLAAHEYFVFKGVVVDADAEVSDPGYRYDMRIEVYGDSVSAGEVTEAIYNEGKIDPPDHRNKLDNSWFSYPFMLGRFLNAEVHDIAQGGIALLDGTGYFTSDGLIGMKSVYGKISYSPYYENSDWDFSRWTPDLVIFAIGQNDANPDPDCLRRPDYRRMWKDSYIEVIRDLMEKYPKAKFLLTLTVLRHDPIWDEAIDEIAKEMSDERVIRFNFTRGGAATDGHPRATEHAEMATELAAFINRLQ